MEREVELFETFSVEQIAEETRSSSPLYWCINYYCFQGSSKF